MIRVALVEDDPQQMDRLYGHLKRYEAEEGKVFQIEQFYDGKDIVMAYQHHYDIIMLDIEMPQMNGMEAARKIRTMDSEVVIVFITNMAQYAIDGYEVNALDFMLKPVAYNVFAMKMKRIVERFTTRMRKELLLNAASGMVRVNVKDIMYVEINNRILHYHLETVQYSVKGTMQAAEDELSPYNFVRCNSWYLVNLRYVREVRGNIAVVGDVELEISRRKLPQFLQALTNYVGGNS